jgi:hypothetical protein
MLVTADKNKKAKDRSGMPDLKKLERTGKDTFVVHADGGNKFEGKITDPSKAQFKPTNRIVAFQVGICIRACLNRNEKCDSCYRFSELKES